MKTIILFVAIVALSTSLITGRVMAKSIADCSGDKSIIDAYKSAYMNQHLDMKPLQGMIDKYNSQCGNMTGWE